MTEMQLEPEWEYDSDSPELTPEMLLGAKALKRYGYRQMWSRGEWALRAEGFSDYGVYKVPEVKAARERWASEVGKKYNDNHETFLVEISSGLRLFVTFTDGFVRVGTGAYADEAWELPIKASEVQL